MKANIPVKLTDVQRKQLKAHVKSMVAEQIIDTQKQYEEDLKIMLMYTLYKDFGFGKKRLTKLWYAVGEWCDELRRNYYLEDEDFTKDSSRNNEEHDTAAWLARREMRESGFDIDSLIEEGEREREKRLAERQQDKTDNDNTDKRSTKR